MNTASVVQLLITGTMLTWATIHDVRHYTIPVGVLLLGGVAGFTAAFVFHGEHGVVESIFGGVLGETLGWILVHMARLGEGDAFLFLALGILLGPILILSIFVWSNVLVLIRLGVPVLKRRKIRIAVAPYIFAGTFFSLLIPLHLF